jgi:beta-galactosidase/beta-glucuronidase
MQWSKERAWAWYNSMPWIRGCNYMSADCANRIDQWQSHGFEERFETTEKELQLMQKLGFNSVRLIIEFIVWNEEHNSFMERFERYISLCSKYGISCMIVLANDCVRPKGIEESHLGEQHFDWGYHGGRKISQHDGLDGMGDHVLDYPEKAERYYEMVREIVERYKSDERILMWNIYNEVGNARREEVSLPHLKRLFEIVRAIDPIQPLTCEAWRLGTKEITELSEAEQYALENSDIVSFHCYLPYRSLVKNIKTLKKLGRPIVCTEWLNRIVGNNVQEIFPLFYLDNIGCYNWGFVAGKYQTYEPWNFYWEIYDKDTSVDFDFTKWFHDLYRPNHRPYDPKEEEIIKHFCSLADKEFNSEHKI